VRRIAGIALSLPIGLPDVVWYDFKEYLLQPHCLLDGVLGGTGSGN
jgi:hypothetical protein